MCWISDAKTQPLTRQAFTRRSSLDLSNSKEFSRNRVELKMKITPNFSFASETQSTMMGPCICSKERGDWRSDNRREWIKWWVFRSWNVTNSALCEIYSDSFKHGMQSYGEYQDSSELENNSIAEALRWDLTLRLIKVRQEARQIADHVRSQRMSFSWTDWLVLRDQSKLHLVTH